jgi:hypothetical protein
LMLSDSEFDMPYPSVRVLRFVFDARPTAEVTQTSAPA